MKINRLMDEIVKEKGLKQTYLAERVGMTPDAVSKILRGERKLTAEEFLVFCDVLDVNPNVFRTTAA